MARRKRRDEPSLPHARGGVSSLPLVKVPVGESSPRPWGCFRRACSARATRKVFPTPVGVFLFPPSTFRAIGCLPHARGGVSHAIQTLPIAARSSPRPWGCFYASRLLYGVAGVVPTPVGVFLIHVQPAPLRIRLPHARGGVSGITLETHTDGGSSPRPWGCFYHIQILHDHERVFPTPVGVFRLLSVLTARTRCLPHARGGVSLQVKK